jgi:hypothetical protein
MTTPKLFGAALVLSVIAVAPVSAQQAIDEPGSYAFFHPNADVLNAGSVPPANAMAQSLRGGDVAATHMAVRTHRMSHSIKHY